MFKPSVGELLLGITDSLRDTVLTKVEDPVAKRQLKAALHGLGRLQRSWDLWPGYLATDNDDLSATLGDCIQRLQVGSQGDGIQALGQHLHAEWTGVAIKGINDPALQAAASRNLHLQGVATQLQDWLYTVPDSALVATVRQDLLALHQRRAERTTAANSDEGDQE